MVADDRSLGRFQYFLGVCLATESSYGSEEKLNGMGFDGLEVMGNNIRNLDR